MIRSRASTAGLTPDAAARAKAGEVIEVAPPTPLTLIEQVFDG
jgi:hypothetical protein